MDQLKESIMLYELSLHIKRLQSLLDTLNKLHAEKPEIVDLSIITYVRGTLLRYMRIRRRMREETQE